MMKRASVVKRFGLWAAVSLVIMMMSVLCITSMAAESQPRVLRVAFCEAKGITEKKSGWKPPWAGDGLPQ